MRPSFTGIRIPLVATAVFLAAALVLASCVATRTTRQAIPDAPRDPNLVHGVLPNGFQYLVMKNTTPEDRVSMHLNVFAGSVQEREGEEGIAHFLEHMLFNGSDHFKPGELVTYFQSIGMDFGADANARTSFFSTVYDLNLPKGDKAHLEDGLLVMRDYAGGALLLQSEIDRERGVVLAEKRERDSVSFRTFKEELAFEFPGSLLARRLPIGKEEVLKTADRAVFKAFYDRWYRPDNLALVVVGDVDVHEVIPLIKEAFSPLKARSNEVPAAAPDISWQPHEGIKPFYFHEPESGNTQITLERLTHTPFRPETLETVKARVVQYLGDLMLDNRLSRMVREQTAGFTGANVYSGTYLRNVEIAALQASCPPEKWETSLAQLENSLRQALTFGFQAGELARVKADYIASLASDMAGAGTRKSAALARSILSALNREGLFLSPAQRLEILKPFVEGLELNTVNQAFQASWEADHRLVLVTGNAEIGPEPLEKIQRVYHRAAGAPLSAYQVSQAREFPYLTLPDTRAAVTSRKDNVRGLGITQVTFDNHVRLNVKSTEFKKGEFRFKAVFGRGKAGMPAPLAGLSSLAQSAVRESGLGSLDLDQLQAALAGRDVTIGFEIHDTYFSLEGTAEPKDAELVFQLLYAYLNDPGFRETGLSLAKSRYRQAYEAMERTTDGMMKIRGNRFLAGGDPRFGLADPETADQVPLTVIREWLSPRFASAPLEVSVVGDIDTKGLLDAASAYLGALTPRERPAGSAEPGPQVSFPSGQSVTMDLQTRIDKGVVRVAFLTDDFWDIMQTRKLSVLSRVFSERLRLQIREALGASYSPYVYNNPSLIYDGYGVLQAVVNTDPASFDLVAAQVTKIAADLAENGVTEAELALVKAPIMAHLKVLRQDNGYWLDSVMADSFRHPEKLEWSGHLVNGYDGITAEDLSKLARRYLKVSDRALILIRPGS